MIAPNVVCDRPHPRVRVARFTRPDLRAALYDAEPISDCDLFRQLATAAELDTLAAGESLVVNFGLVEWFPTIFYQVLVALRNEVHRHHARLILCCLPPLVREAFDVMGGGRLFDVRSTESRAVIDASQLPPYESPTGL